MRVGVDSGGTFTDICLFDDATGRIVVWKVASTPDDPSRGIADGVAEGLALVEAPPASVDYFGHGTTVATNALIQHRGVRTGLITTDGFRDLLEIGRQKRPDLYDLQADKPPVLVPRDLRLEVPERVRHDGSVEVPLDEAALRGAVRRLRAAGVRAVAVCFLYSFVRPEHEAAALRILAEEFPEAFACVSHQVAPEFREYERMSTTVVNAYLGPVMRGYIERLGDRLADAGRTCGAASDAIQRRGDRVRPGGAAAGAHGAVGAFHGRDRRGGSGARRGLFRADHLRHGRHLDRRCVAGWRRVQAGKRGCGARLSDQGTDAGYPYGRRGRRFDCVCR